jgi:hypothetical protein
MAGAFVVLLGSMVIGSGVAEAGTAASISSVEGQQLSNVVVDSLSSCDPSSLQNITIDWGDGGMSSGAAFEAGTSGCGIAGSHKYSEEGSYITKVSYSFATGAPGHDAGTATVADAPVGPSAVNDFVLSAGSPLNAVVANWSDTAPEALSSYSATIDWGDGGSSAGAIGSGTVSGSHTYVNGGRFPITITFRDDGGVSATAHEHAVVSGCPSSAPSSPGALFSPSASGLNARYVQALYNDALGRAPSTSELSGDVQALSLGATRNQLAVALLGSNEYRAKLIASDYGAYLHRAPSTGDTSAFLQFLGSGNSDAALIAQILGSSEYLASRGNHSADGFLSAMYCDTVFRSIDQFAQNNDDSALGSGTSRAAIAAGLLGTTEYRSRLVNGFYLHYLRRAGTFSDLATWSAYINSGGTDEKVIASIASSPEYFDLFNPTVAVATSLRAQGNTVSTTLNRYAKLTLTVLRIVPLGHTSAVKITAPHTRLVGVINFGPHHRGRVVLHWNRKVHGTRLRRGNYLLLLKAYSRHKLIGISDAVRFGVR